MGRKAKAKREANKRPTVQIQHPMRTAPNWALLVLSILGILLASYLTWTDWVGSHVKGCAVGSSCDIVLSSSWARLLGFPTAFWGLLAYVTLAATAFIKRADQHWWAAWGISLFGVLYSAYLTTVSLTILHAACPYCLTSLVLMTSIFVLVTYQRPAVFDSFSWPRWLTKTVPIAAAVILILHLNYTGVLGEAPAPEDPEARALAIHLSESGAKMYGAFWCPHCQQQKSIFGPSASRLPYIECSPNGQGSPQADVCKAEHIQSYPTWVINGKHIEEVLSLKQLAEDTGFQLGASKSNQNP
jgi:uncharacterized membrane protein